MENQRVAIPGSIPKHSPETRWLSDEVAEQHVSATVHIRRHSGSNEKVRSDEAPALSREEREVALRADPSDLFSVRSFLTKHSLTVTWGNPGARTLRIQGTTKQMESAFGVKLRYIETASGKRCLSYNEPLTVPASLSGIITAVLGLDQRPTARPHG